jgi:hypothetical protein
MKLCLVRAVGIAWLSVAVGLGCGGSASYEGAASAAGSGGESGAATGGHGGAQTGAASGTTQSSSSGSASGGTRGSVQSVGSGSSSGGAGPDASAGFALAIPNQSIDKVDLLFDIDNSASMGDKQQYLVQAIPDLIDGLVDPNCVDTTTLAPVGVKSMAGCPAGSKPEFPAVKDMHIGIVSSSLGPRLSEIDPTFVTGVCNDPQQAQAPFGGVNAHMDDQAHLLSRSLTGAAQNLVEGAVADAASGFLYWYPEAANMVGINGPPTGPATPIQNAGMTGAAGTLEGDFGSLVSGVGVFGCGIESQMESWYRFLVQPDPYETLGLDTTRTVSGQHPAQWVGVDSTIIQERHDFLRPDSLVAVVVLSDENDSEIDVRSLGGLGYFFMRTGFAPPHGTSACTGTPAQIASTCASCSPGSTDPACAAPGGEVAVYSAVNDWGYDPNLRHVHMRQKYGLDPQFPVERYFYGLTSPTVPDRNGEYPAGATNYSGFGQNMNCVNPLYAAAVPGSMALSATATTSVSAADAKALCNLAPGTRTSDKVFFAHIGGVPHQLLHFEPGNPAASTLSPADWVKILGTDPEHYNYNGIDPHMYESYTPRLPGQAETLVNPPTFDPSGTNALSDTGSPSNTDPVSGREWITDLPLGGHRLEVDRQFACIFPLTTPRDCTQAVNCYACDCPSTPLTHDQTPPVCSDTMPTMQVAAKAYPTVRELLVAKMMGVQGIVSSICPVDVLDNAAGDDPLYGYRPAVSAIVDRLKGALTFACLPRQLPVVNGAATCVMLVTLPAQAGGSCTHPTCDASRGLAQPDPTVLANFCAKQEAAYLMYGGVAEAPGDPASESVCELRQLTTLDPQASAEFDPGGSCAASANPGWCYTQSVTETGCAQSLVFANGAVPQGALTTIECNP